MLLLAASAYAQDNQWPPPEVSDRGPIQVDSVPSVAPEASTTSWGLHDYADAIGWAIGGAATAIGACHLRLRFFPGGIDVSGGRGDPDPELLSEVRALREELAVARPLLEGLLASRTAPAGSPPPQPEPAPVNPDPAPLRGPRPLIVPLGS
jgi:hypothetical protein